MGVHIIPLFSWVIVNALNSCSSFTTFIGDISSSTFQEHVVPRCRRVCTCTLDSYSSGTLSTVDDMCSQVNSSPQF